MLLDTILLISSIVADVISVAIFCSFISLNAIFRKGGVYDTKKDLFKHVLDIVSMLLVLTIVIVLQLVFYLKDDSTTLLIVVIAFSLLASSIWARFNQRKNKDIISGNTKD